MRRNGSGLRYRLDRILFTYEAAWWFRLLARAGPRGFRVGRHLRYLEADVETWIDTQRDRDPAA